MDIFTFRAGSLFLHMILLLSAIFHDINDQLAKLL